MRDSYVCPGEKYPIPRAVHLARLAAFYPKCRECPHRNETGALTPEALKRLEQVRQPKARRSLWVEEGIRGVYLNELTRQKASEYVAALAAELWREAPLVGVQEPAGSPPKPKRQGPLVVVGRDRRPSSPDIFVGVVNTLRRMGCHVVDVGVVSKPCFNFAVAHLQAAAGVYVTGTGKPATWTGCDFVSRGAQPMSLNGRLAQLAERLRLGCSRPTRSAGPYRYFQARVPYEAVLWKHFHDVRPLTVVCACLCACVEGTLERLFEKIPARLVQVPVQQAFHLHSDPDRLRRLEDRVGLAVRQASAAFGLIIDEDGMSCRLFDELGHPVPQEKFISLLTQLFSAETGHAKVVLPATTEQARRNAVEQAGGEIINGGESAESLWRALQTTQAHFGLDERNRLWLQETVPVCDALLLLGKIFDALNLMPEQPLSALNNEQPTTEPPSSSSNSLQPNTVSTAASATQASILSAVALTLLRQ